MGLGFRVRVRVCFTVFGAKMTLTNEYVGCGRSRQVMINGNSFRKMVDSTASAVLVVGPMGAGKSTTIAIQTGAKYEAVKEEVEQGTGQYGTVSEAITCKLPSNHRVLCRFLTLFRACRLALKHLVRWINCETSPSRASCRCMGG